MEKLAIALEFVSFFLVTVDLYGERRIVATHAFLTNFIDRFRYLVLPALDVVNKYFMRAYGIPFVATMALGYAVDALFSQGLISISGKDLFAPEIPQTHIALRIIALLMMSWIFVGFGLLGLWSVFWLAAGVLIQIPFWLLVKFRLKGVLLVVGALLFTGSKLISFVHAK